MKKMYRWILASLLVSALASCSDNEEQPPVTPPTSDFENFDLAIDATTKNSVEFTITPHDSEMTYIAMIVEKSYYDSFESDEHYINDDLEWFEEIASTTAVNLDVYLRSILKQGTVNASEKGLTPDTEYYLYAYGLTDQCDVLTAPDKIAFKTAGFDLKDEGFAVEVSDITYNSVKVKVTPENKAAYYFVNVFSEERYQEFGGDENAFFEQLLFVRDYYLNRGASIEQILANLTSVGNHELLFDDLDAGTKYYAYALGVDSDFYANTAPEVVTFSTPEATQADLTFDIQISEVGWESLSGTVTPSNNEDSYICSVQLAESMDWYESEAEFINTLLMDLEYWYGGVEGSLKVGPSTLDGYTGLYPATDYVVVCFGWDEVATTSLTIEPFTTAEATQDPATFSASFEVSDIKYSSANVKICPTNGTWYFFDWCEQADFEQLVKEQGSEQSAVAACCEEEILYGAEWFDGDRLGYLNEMGAIQGTRNYPVQGLKDQTSYVLMVMCVDLTTGELLPSGYAVSEPFTTPELIVSDAAVSFEFGGIYDGSELAQLDPANYLKCTGYAVMPYTVIPTASAAEWYTNFYAYDMSEWGPTDEDIYNELITYGYEWDPESVSLNRTEGLAVMNWDTVFTFLGIAADSAGNFGHGTLELVNVTKENIRPAEELLGSSTPLASPAKAVWKKQPKKRPTQTGIQRGCPVGKFSENPSAAELNKKSASASAPKAQHAAKRYLL